MRSNMVVPMLEYFEFAIELLSNIRPYPAPHPPPQPLSRVRERGVSAPVEILFERAEQALDPAVLPRAAGGGALVADAELFQPETELF